MAQRTRRTATNTPRHPDNAANEKLQQPPGAPGTQVTNVDRASSPLPEEPTYASSNVSQVVPIRNSMGQISNITVTSDINREYVASMMNVWGSYIEGIRSLPTAIDDLTGSLGVDLYERMAFDPQCLSLVNIMKAATLSQPVDLSPALTDESAPRYKLALEIHDFFERVFARLDPTLPVVLDNMLDALYLGNKIAELVYVDGDPGTPDALRHVLRKISVKDRRSVLFVVDKYGNILGFVPAIASNAMMNVAVGLFDPEKQELVNSDKCAVLSFRPRNGDPRGVSIFRAAYNGWWLKMQIWPELLKYLAQFGGPAIVGFTSPDSRDIPILDDNGVKVGEQSPEEIMLAQLEAWRNGSVAAFPFGSLVEVVQATGNAEAFLNSINMLNRELTKAITGQELATNEGQHQARSASEVHATILELAIVFIKELVCQMLMQQVMRPSVIANWGEKNIDLIPKASLGKVKKADKAALMASYTAAGWPTHPSQWAAIDAEMDVPPRDPASIEEAITMAQEKHAAEIAPPPAPVLAPGGSGTGRGRTAPTGRSSSTAGTRTPRKPQPKPAVQNRTSA